jgi:hypothetical protein
MRNPNCAALISSYFCHHSNVFMYKFSYYFYQKDKRAKPGISTFTYKSIYDYSLVLHFLLIVYISLSLSFVLVFQEFMFHFQTDPFQVQCTLL